MKSLRRILRYSLIFVVLVFLAIWAYSAYVSKPLFTETHSELQHLPGIASADLALTLARTENSLLLVKGFQSGKVKAIDLSSIYGINVSADPIGLFLAAGYDSLASLTEPEITIGLSSLQLPLDFGFSHLAAGTNYIEHAEEVSLDDPPFLFPKLSEPTPWNSPVKFTRRLDYEAELAFVPLTDIASPNDIPAYGMILVNDFTDRWTLIKGLNLKEPMGTTGFAASKGQETFLPAGYFLVIPKEQDFYKEIEIRLFVNDRLRQRFHAEEMILKYEDIISQAFIDREMVYRNKKLKVDLIPDNGIERGSMILTGTAGGVIFKPVNIWRQGIYLKPGDVVRTEASFLGHMENEIQRSLE